MTGSLCVALLTAVAIWLSRSAIGATDEGVPGSRIGFLRPWWELTLLLVGTTLLTLRLRFRFASVCPACAAALLLLPWLPGPIATAFMVWSDGLMPLVWLAVGVGLLAAVPPSAWQKPRRWFGDGGRAPVAASFLAFLLMFSASKQIAPRIPTGDEPHYLVIAQTLLHHGHLQIEATHRDGVYREYFDGELRPHYLRRGQDGAIYSIHAPGLPVLLLPVFAVAGYPGVVVLLALIAAAGSGLAWRAAFLVTGSAAAAWFGWAAIALSAPYFFHSFTVYPDLIAAVIVLLGVWPVLVERSFSRQRWAVQGGLLAILPWLHTRFALLALALAVVAFVRMRQGPDTVRRALAFCAVPLISAAAWHAFFYAVYGTVDPRAPYGHSTDTAVAYIPSGLTGLLVDQQFGILPNAPVYAVVGTGLFVLWRRRAALTESGAAAWLPMALLLIMVPYLAAVTSYAMWWGGLSAPGRFAVPVVLPLAMAAAAFWRWPVFAVARPLGLALLVVSVFISGVLALVDRGSLLYDVRGPRALWLDWVSPSVDVALAWPSLFRDGPQGALLLSGVWLAWFATAGLVLAALCRWRTLAPPGLALATTLAMAAVITGGLTSGWRVIGQAPQRHDPAALRLLRQFDAAARPVGVSYQPLRVSAAERFLPHLAVTALLLDGDAEQPLFAYARVPAGRYRLKVEATADVTDRISVVVGRERHAELAVLNAARQPATSFGMDIDLPVRVHSLVAYGEGTARQGLSRATLQPVWMPTRPDRVRAVQAARAKQYGDGVVFFLNNEADIEPTGFWVRGGRQADIVVTRPVESAFVRLFLRNGPIDNTVDLGTAGVRTTILLAPREERLVQVPAPPGRSSVRIQVRPDRGFRPAAVDPDSTDERWLGSWIEIR